MLESWAEDPLWQVKFNTLRELQSASGQELRRRRTLLLSAAGATAGRGVQRKLQENEMIRDNYDQFEYDVALSFAGEDRALAEELGDLFSSKDIKVFYDEYH